MLPRSKRLVAKRDFDVVYRRSGKLRSSGFTLAYLNTRSSLPTKIGIVVSKKVSPRAVKRNLYRRRIAACLIKLKKVIPVKGFKIVIVINSLIVNEKYQQIYNSLAIILTKIR